MKELEIDKIHINKLPIEKLRFRHPNQADGAKLWQFVKDSGTLDLNSPYFYITMSHWFSESSYIVEDTEQHNIVGMVIGFCQPAHPDTLFIWQIAVRKNCRGLGIAKQMLDRLVLRADVQYVEATISPSNMSSLNLFEKWAGARNAPIHKTEGFEAELFPNHEHETEDLYRIGPLKKLR